MKYYKDIEVPIWNLNKISETNDIRYLLILDDYFDLPEEEKIKDIDTMVITYSNICDELFEKFGIDKDFIIQAKKEKDLLKMQLRILAGEKHLKPRYKALRRANENTDKNDQSFNDKLIMLETHFKRDFDVHKMSAEKFYTYVKRYKEDNK